MSADLLLARLNGVRRTGDGRWIARCPSHNDRRPSLSIRELDDGRILVHDFGGCAVADVLAALSLEFDALFPPRAISDQLRRERRPFDAFSILRCIAAEAEIASLAADNLSNGMLLSDPDRERLRTAAMRLCAALELTNG